MSPTLKTTGQFLRRKTMATSDSSKTWPSPSPVSKFSTLPTRHNLNRAATSRRPRRRPDAVVPPSNFADLPSDVLSRIAAAFDMPDLWAASAVCRPWRAALMPLREAAVLLRWGKRFKHGRRSRQDSGKALESFLKASARGSAAAMVDAGLMYWEMGRKDEGRALYRRSAELGYPAGQCNLGICYLEGDPPDLEEAVKWFYQAAKSGYARAQYNLALCLHRGRGVKCNLPSAAKWYLRAAEGGNMRAMYNSSLCYSMGEGLPRNLRHAKAWMKRAADYGHCKAQFEHGLDLFSAGDNLKALVYLELATRAGETSASHIRDVILQSISQTSHDQAMRSVDRWRPTQHPRWT